MTLVTRLVAVALTSAVLSACQSSEQTIAWNDFGDDPMQSPEFLEQWMVNGTPGEHHERLARFTGTWDAAGKSWANPTAEPTEWDGTSTSRMILNGRYLMQEYRTEFMGQTFEGVLLQGYDNLRQEYFTTWIDSTSTGPLISRGTRDEAGVLNMVGTAYDPRTPAGRPTRTTITEVSDDEVVMDTYDITMDGEEFRAFQMTYTRRQE